MKQKNSNGSDSASLPHVTGRFFLMYARYASFLMICAPCLRNIFRLPLNLDSRWTFYESVIFDGMGQ